MNLTNLILNNATLARIVLDILFVSLILIISKIADLVLMKNEAPEKIHTGISENINKDKNWKEESKSA